MTATRATFSAILKEFYVGSVVQAINDEMMVVEHFEKATLDWNGKQAIIPIHTSRNSGVFVADEAGAFQTAGRQGYSRLVIEAKYQYGRFQITGPAIASAANGGKAAFVGWMDAEMTNLKDDVRDSGNRYCVSGGQVKGFINERCSRAECGSNSPGGALTVTTAAMQMNPVNGSLTNASWLLRTDFDYRGDFSIFIEAGTDPTDGRTWVPIIPFRTDTYQPSWYDVAGGNGISWFVCGFDKTAGTVAIACGGDAAGVSWSSVVKPGYVTAIALNPIQAICSSTAGGTTNIGVDLRAAAAVGPLTNFNREPIGMYGNLAPGQGSSFVAYTGTPGDNATNHYTVTRGSAFVDGEQTYTVGGAQIIRSMIVSSVDGSVAVGVNTGTVDQSATALTVTRMQTALDRVLLDGEAITNAEIDGYFGAGTGTGTTVDAAGGEINLIMMSPSQRTRYVAALQANLSMSLNVGQSGPTKTGDAGILSVSYSGVPIKVSRAVDNGLLIFLKTDTWNLAELQAPGFADLDGEVISRVSGSDQFEGYYRWYWNLVCKKPNNNVIMTGFTL